MSRVTTQEVIQIVDVPTNTDVGPFIEAAGLIIDENLNTSGLSVNRLHQIELYLSAHFTAISIERGSIIGSKALDAEDKYSDQYDKGLNLTRYGQQAIMFDTSGILASMASPSKKAEFRVV